MGIKSFDFFRKLNQDVGETNTVLGGFFTFIAIIIVIFLAYHETILFQQIEIDYQTVVDNDSANFINVYLDIIIQTPCQVLSLDQQDEVGVHILDVGGTLRKIRLDSKRRVINEQLGSGIPSYRGSDQELSDVIDSINDGEQCQIVGFFKVNKVPGNFHISYHAQHVLTQRVIQRSIDTYKKMRLDHSINDLHFGDLNEISKLLKRYPQQFQQNYNTKWTSISKQSPSDIKQDYEYHLNALPARFYDTATKSYKIFYKYSITEAVMARSVTEMDAIYFRYQISPVNMVYSFKEKSIYHFIVQLLAILGGVIAVIGILHSIVQKMF